MAQRPSFIPEDPFAHFLENIANVRSDRELSMLIAKMGIYNQLTNPEVEVHPRFRRFSYEPNVKKGLWNDPDRLAGFLWSNKDEWKAKGVKSCLEIGTFTGYGFFVVSTFLKTFVNADMTFKTIDVIGLDESDPVYNYIKDYFQLTDSDGIVAAGEKYDLVLIDGSTEKEWLAKDMNNTLPGAKAVYFMATPGMRAMRFGHSIMSNIMEIVTGTGKQLLPPLNPRDRHGFMGVLGN